ncbi:hypothetical protein GQ457_05G022790 [Hibiscus cannabinus]
MSRSIRRFWWSGKSSARGWPLVAWDDICLPKAAGGIRFKDLHLFNIALLGKQIWRLLSAPGSLPYRTLRAKYFPDGDLFSASAPARSSFAWKGLHCAMLRLRDGFYWTLGIDSQVRLFRDRWGGFSPITLAGDSIEREEIPLCCREFMVPRQARWDRTKLLANLPPGDVDSILEVPISPDRADTLVLGDHDSGLYTVRSGYLFLQRPPSPLSLPPRLWKILAKLPTIPKVRSFGWRCGWEALPVGSRLRDAGLSDGACPLCGVGLRRFYPLHLVVEDDVLLFLDYASASASTQVPPPVAADPPRWRPPPVGSVKVNVDGAFLPSARLGAIGVIARDSSGAVLGGSAKPVPVHGPASTVEVSALFAGLDFAIANAWPSALIESDAAVLVNKLHRPTVDLSLLGDVLAPSRALLAANAARIRVGFASRLANTAAHTLASWACNNNDYIPEIEKTTHKLRKETKERKRHLKEEAEIDSSIGHLSIFQEVEERMANRTLKELAAPDLDQQPLCITFPNFEGEDPHKHLKEFHIVCSGMKPHGVTDEQINLRAFPFSLKDKAKDWLYYLPPGSITTWNGMKRLFLEKYFHASRAANIRKEIYCITQLTQETLYEYWERFKRLCASFPHHQIPDQLLIQYFYEGLLPMDRSMIDAASGGALVNLTPEGAKELISNMAENSQQFGTRMNAFVSQVNEMNTLKDQISDLTTLIRQMGVGQEMKETTQNLGNQITQLATSMSKLEAQNSGKLPSQTEVNPRENCNAISLRSGKEIPSGSIPHSEAETSEDGEIKISSNVSPKVTFDPPLSLSSYTPLPPFPSRLSKPKEDENKEILDTFRKVEINIPLVDAIKQIPKYANFLKELCTRKRRLKEKERVHVSKNVSAILQKNMPEKCGDPGMFSLPCIIGNKKIEHAMLDLGASINVMPISVYQELKLNDMQRTGVVIQLADRSYINPLGVVEDVLVQVNELLFPVDFYILEMEGNSSSKTPSILLGRPFMKTSKTKIDVDDGTLSVEFGGEIAKFNIFDAMKYPNDTQSLCQIDVIDSIVQDVFADELKLCEQADLDEIDDEISPKEIFSASSLEQEGSGSRKRFRMGKGKAVLPPTEDDLNGFLKFTTKARKTRYADIKTRRVNPGKYVHTQSLEELQIREAFESMTVSMWWKNFVTINCPTFIELTREFYTTFKFDIPENFTFDTKDIVKYKLMGKEFSQSITEFNLALGLVDTTFVTTDNYKSSTVDFVDAFCSSGVWKDMSSDNSHYNPSSSKGATLRRPEWVYMQRFLAFSFSGRKDTANICTKTELYFIWSMLHDNPINLGFWLASQFHSILTNGKSLCLGFVITHLAINLNLITLDDTNLHVACEMEPLNIDSLLKMKVLAKVAGVYTFAQICHPMPSDLFAGLFEKTTPPLHNDAIETGSSDPWARIERRLSRMEKNLEALMHHCGVQPPCPSSP